MNSFCNQYQGRTSQYSRTRFLTNAVKNDEQTISIITEMISNAKYLLQKTTTIKEYLENIKQDEKISTVDQNIQQFKAFQKSIKLTFFPKGLLNQHMAGAFTLRLCKEMAFWRPTLPFLIEVIHQIDNTFQEQKESREFIIELLYFLAIKRINSRANDMINKFYSKLFSKEYHLQQHQQKEVSLLQKVRMRQVLKESQRIKKLKMIELMEKFIGFVYEDLQVIGLQPISQFSCDLNEEQNVQVLVKEQIYRNRNLRKSIHKYSQRYKHFEHKKMKDIEHKISAEGKLLFANKSISKKRSFNEIALSFNPNIRENNQNIPKLPILQPNHVNNFSQLNALHRPNKIQRISKSQKPKSMSQKNGKNSSLKKLKARTSNLKPLKQAINKQLVNKKPLKIKF